MVHTWLGGVAVEDPNENPIVKTVCRILQRRIANGFAMNGHELNPKQTEVDTWT